MKDKLLRFVRAVEVVLLRFFITIYKAVAKASVKVAKFIVPKWKLAWKTIVLALLAIYVIGAVVFGIRLYKQKKFEKIDLVASYVYPFPVANSGRAIIYDKQLQQWVAASKTFALKNGVDVPPDLAQKIVKELADYQLSSQEGNAMGVRLSSKDINEKFELSIQGIGTKEQAIDYIKQMYGLSLNQFKHMITPMIMSEKVREDEFVGVVVRHILIKDEKKANDVLTKVKAGENFEELAKQNSEDESSKDQGGLLAGGEPVYRDSGLVKEFEDAMMKLKKGETSELVKTEFGFHIIRIDDRQGTVDQSFTDWLDGLRKKYPQRFWI